ncbi:MAG TPA: thioredoxin [Polyangiales bacterium]|nr:thioredoxin [Polyangiales bacterium]
MAVQVSDQDFEAQVIRSEQPVLVDLYADWCQPCKQLEPILRELENELSGKIKFVRVDVDKSPMLARAFRVQSIPMLVLLKEGRPVDQIVGMADKKTIAAMLQPFIPQAADEVQPPDLAVLLQSNRAVAVDVRDPGAFARYRIPGAINVPADQLATRTAELKPSDGRVRVLYGRSGDEGRDLAAKVRESGVQVAFLSGGFLHWEAARLPVERGA